MPIIKIKKKKLVSLWRMRKTIFNNPDNSEICHRFDFIKKTFEDIMSHEVVYKDGAVFIDGEQILMDDGSAPSLHYFGCKKDDMDDDHMIESRLVPIFDIPYSVLRLEDDEYYGSDFIRMAAILQETEKNQPGMADIFCNWSRLKDKSPLSSDAELECSNDMDDGSTWAEGPLRNPKLEHIIVCHALHALCTHMNWSIPDVLRINDLSIEVKLTIQQFSDQERNRLDWCSNYDLQHFKEVLLKEAADRPEGVSLENALLQRCRDYFEDIADEILDKVGLSDIDLYLETLKNRIDKS